MSSLACATLEADLAGALALGGRALSFVEQAGRPVLASASFRAEALVMGALQREDTLRQRSPAAFGVAVTRRLTTGTEARLSGAVLYHALALPRVDSLFPDAKPRTLLNRNLRALLRGYTAAGVPLRYFGTEVLALLGHPVALVGYDQVASGACLIEVLIGLDAPCVVRPALKREAPSALLPILRQAPVPHELLERAVAGIASRQGATLDDVTEALLALPGRTPQNLPDSPVIASVSIPLGVIEAVDGPLAIMGDLLVGSAALARFAALAPSAESPQAAWAEAFQDAPLDGARPTDLLQLVGASA